MPREIITEWVTPSGSEFVTVMFFDILDDVAAQREAVGDFWRGFATSMSTLWAWRVRTEGRELSDSSGGLTGAWSESTTQSGTGSSTNEALPEASQVLIRWKTDTIAGSRFLQGRTFVPGIIVQASQDGEVDPPALASFGALATALRTADVGFGIWHRPRSGSGGLFRAATSSSVWSEFAVLRRRRG